MNALVTGGTGFIGRIVVCRLLQNRHRVKIIARTEKNMDRTVKGKVKVYGCNICDTVRLERLRSELKDVDVIFHLAASLDYFGKKEKLFQVNVKGTQNLLKLAVRNRVRKFIFTSSIEAMGLIKKENIPADETCNCKPVSPYGESKLEAEKQVRKFTKEGKLDTVILRLGNVYGPGSPAFIVPIANAILSKDKLRRFLHVYKDRYLHLVYIGDVVDGIVKAAQKADMSETYILAGEEYITIGRLFELIAEGLNTPVDLRTDKRKTTDNAYLNLRKRVQRVHKRADLLTYFVAGEGDRIHRAYSIEKARKSLDYSPEVILKNGIIKTLEWAERQGLLKR